MSLFYERQIMLRTNDFDSNDKITPYAILDIFQDVAGAHATQLGVGFDAMYQRNMYWILIRTSFEVVAEPKPLTWIKVKTWPHPKGKIDFAREYLLTDQDDNILVKGISKWVVIDANTRRLTRTSNIDFGSEDYYENNNYDDIAKKDYSLDDTFTKIASYEVLAHHIDHNKHMNNSKYAEMILDSLKGTVSFKSLHIEHIKEATLGDTINLYMKKVDNAYYYLGYKGDEKLFSSILE